MKTTIKSITAGLLAGLAFIALGGAARADLSISNSTTTTSWNLAGGQSPFYVSIPSANLTGFSAQGQPSAGSGATFTVLSESFTITNGAGTLANGGTNYVLSGLAILGGNQPANSSIHLYDITTNLTSNNGTPFNGSGATYNFVANGDLLGNGKGLSFTNTIAGTDQVLFNLSSGPTTQDQVVLGKNHTYALEFWTPSTGGFSWSRNSVADAGGQGMGSHDASLGAPRLTIASLGLAGAAPRTFTLALYGSPTSAPFSVNSSTNPVVAAATTNLVVDDFVPAGVSSGNPANYDYYSSVQNYASGQITNVYGNWFGGAFQSVAWDATSDASNNPSSGSLKISLNFSSANSQFVLWNQGSANNFFALNINAVTYTNFQCDVRFSADSASDSGSFGSPIFGHLRFGDRTGGYSQDWFGSVDVAASNTNWVHVSIPLNAIADQNLTNIQGLLMGIDRGYYGLNLNGPSTLWVDNIKFVGPATVAPVTPPTLSISAAKPGLRIFAGSTINTYDRSELASVDQNQSWIGGAYPVSYAFTLLSYPANINQTHIFLIPVNTAGNNMYNNEFVDYQSTNGLWLNIQPAAGGVTGTVMWKTNLPNANPNQIAVVVTNATAIGTWTLAFSGPNTGTLTAPGASPVAFTITNGTVATDFANPLVAYFGLQPNSTTGQGQYEDWASIAVTGVAGVNENDDFKSDTSITGGGLWSITTVNTGLNTSLQLVTAATPFWASWTLPAFGYGLGAADNVLGSTTAPAPWMLPEYFNGYADGNNIPGAANQGTKTWILIPATCLPTVDGAPFGQTAPAGYFKLFNPPLVN